MYEPSQNSLRARSRPAIAAGLVVVLALLLALVAGGKAHAATPGAPSFVVIQTDDQTLDGLYATARAYPGAPETRAMPATLDLIAKKGITFNRYYVSYPLCCPSRVSLLTGRYAHNHKVKGNVQPNGGYLGFSFRGGDHRTTSPPGCRPTATRPSTSASSSTATAKNRWTPGRRCRPDGPPGTRSSTSTRPTSPTATKWTSTGRSSARSAIRGTGKPANTASATTSAAHSRRPTAFPATTSPTR